MAKIVIYHPDGIAFADAKAEQQAREFLKDDREIISVSTDNFITATRCLIREGFVHHEDVKFQFNEEIINPQPSGALQDWPRGFCDYTDNWLDRLLRYNYD